MPTLSVKECLSFGWTTFKGRAWFFIAISALIIFASMIANTPRVFEKGGDGMLELVGVAAFCVSLALSFLVTLCKTAFYLKAHDMPEAAEVTDLWHPHSYLKYVGVSLLAGIATLIGFILLIVPGIIIGIMVCFSTYIVVDRGLTPIAAIKESVRITKGNRWQLFGLGLTLLAINILGAVALLIGLLVSMPVSALAIVHAYRTLSKGVTA